MVRRSAASIALALALVASGCKSSLAPVRPDEPFVLAPRQRVFVEQANFRLEFLEVTGESRCPSDAICVWAGDATVHLSLVDTGSSVRLELHAGDPARTAVTHRGFVIRLVDLQPYPSSARSIAPGDYRVTLRVTG